MIRSLGAALLATVAVTGVVATPALAAPAPTVTLRAAATGPVSGRAADTAAAVTVTAAVAGAAAPAAVLSVAVPGSADAADVRVDRAVPPAGTVTAVTTAGRTVLTLRLGAGADATTGGTLATGTHTVVITTDLAALDPADIGAVEASFATSAGPAVTAKTSVPLPDLVLGEPDELEEDGTLQLVPGSSAIYGAELAARGAPVQDGELTVAVTPGLRLDRNAGILLLPEDVDGGEKPRATELRCTGDVTIQRCALPTIDKAVFVVVALTAATDAAIGSTATVTVSALAGNGLDATPADNAVSGRVRFVVPTELRVTLRADRVTAPIGESIRVTATVTNEGTGPAADIAALLLSINRKLGRRAKAAFEITGFTGREIPLPSLSAGESGGQVSIPGRALRSGRLSAAVAVAERHYAASYAAPHAASYAAHRAGAPPLFAARAWNVGTLAPGATRRAVLTLKARHEGKAEVSAFALSLTAPDPCVDDDCPNADSVTLRAVAAASPNGGSADPIAATGARTEQWLLASLALLLGGTALQLAGRRRRRARHRG